MAIKTFTAGEVLTASDTNTYLANSGLVYVGEQALSSTTNVNSVFTSTYRNYRLVITTSTTSGSADVGMRLRASGADNSSANYYNAGVRSGYNVTAPSSIGAAAQTGFTIGRVDAGDNFGGIVVDIYNPQTTIRTSFTSQSIDAQFLQSMGGYFDLTNQFDGFTLFGAATWTGFVTVYGYRLP